MPKRGDIVRTTERVIAWELCFEPGTAVYFHLPKGTLLRIINVIGPDTRRTYECWGALDERPFPTTTSVTPTQVEKITAMEVLAIAAKD